MRLSAKTFRAFMASRFDRSELRDIAEHGADSGFHDLTYYVDTSKLYERFKRELWDLVITDADEFGHNNVFEFMASWGGADNIGSDYQFENLMVWYAAERYAHEVTGR